MSRIEPVSKETPLHLCNLIIETTRRCNMNCCHCLRGESQYLDMDLKHVKALFKHTEYIDSITLSGGEPSLVPHILTDIIDIARDNDTEIISFYMATNGKEVSEKFIRALFEWWLFCKDSDFDNLNCVEISSDIFHEKIDINNINKLMAFRFVNTRDVNSNYNNGKQLIWEGRTTKNFFSTRVIDPMPIEIDDNLIQGELYLDCLGNIHSTCDLSYKTMEEGEFCIGNISENNFNLIEAIKSYNLKLEEVDYARTGT